MVWCSATLGATSDANEIWVRVFSSRFDGAGESKLGRDFLFPVLYCIASVMGVAKGVEDISAPAIFFLFQRSVIPALWSSKEGHEECILGLRSQESWSYCTS